VKRSNLNRGTTQLQRKPLKRVSDKRRVDMVEYGRLRKAFLSKRPVCEICKKAPSTDIHHIRKRGIYYLVVDTWMALCNFCHIEKVHGNPNWAREKGYLI